MKPPVSRILRFPSPTRVESAELEARLQREELDSIHQRRKDWLVHVSTLVGLAATFGSCLYILLSGKYGGDVEKFAIAVISSISRAWRQ